MDISLAFRDADTRAQAFRVSAAAAVTKAQGSSDFGPTSPGATAGQQSANMGHHRVQYQYFRDWVYAAIRPIAVRVADQNFRVANKATPATQAIRTAKTAGSDLWLASAPNFVQKDAKDLEILASHPLLDAMESPNDIHTGWDLKYLTATNLSITGLAFWWLGVNDAGQLQIWPLPSSWVRPAPADSPFSQWEVWLPGSTTGIPVDGEDMCRFAYSDPSNPFGALSPLQANSRAVSTDEQIQLSQQQSYKNGIRPSVVLKAGRLPGMPGVSQMGQRPVLTPTQRNQLVTAIRMTYQGWERHRDPFIVDGLIDEIIPFDRSPHEMDYLNSGKMTEDRIWLGFGVNAISAGKREGANRASAYVADDHLCSNVVNPMISLISQSATKRLGPRYARDNEKLVVYIEKARPHDADLELAKMNFAANQQALTVDEIRDYVGKPPMEGGDKLPSQQPQQPPTEVGTQKPGAGAKPPVPRRAEKYDSSQARDEQGQFSGGGGGGGGGLGYSSVSKTKLVKVGSSGQIKLTKPKTAGAASTQLSTMGKICDKAVADFDVTRKLPKNHKDRVGASMRLQHTKAQLGRAMGYARPFTSQKATTGAELSELIASLSAKFGVKPTIPPGAEPKLKRCRISTGAKTYRDCLGSEGAEILWEKQQRIAESAMTKAIRGFFDRQLQSVLVTLDTKSPPTLRTLAPEKLAAELLEPADWTDAFRDMLTPHLYRAVNTGVFAELAMEHTEKAGRLQPLPPRVHGAASDFLRTLWDAPYWQKIHETTRSKIAKTLGAVAGTALGIHAVRGLLRKAIGGKAAQRRAANIAEVESISAVNQGRLFGMNELQQRGHVIEKLWFTRRDDKVRPSHWPLHGEKVGVNENFIVGGEITPYPAWHGLSAEQRSGCRCGVRSVLSEPKPT